MLTLQGSCTVWVLALLRSLLPPVANARPVRSSELRFFYACRTSARACRILPRDGKTVWRGISTQGGLRGHLRSFTVGVDGVVDGQPLTGRVAERPVIWDRL